MSRLFARSTLRNRWSQAPVCSLHAIAANQRMTSIRATGRRPLCCGHGAGCRRRACLARGWPQKATPWLRFWRTPSSARNSARDMQATPTPDATSRGRTVRVTNLVDRLVQNFAHRTLKGRTGRKCRHWGLSQQLPAPNTARVFTANAAKSRSTFNGHSQSRGHRYDRTLV